MIARFSPPRTGLSMIDSSHLEPETAVVLFGASGHAKVVIELLQAQGRYHIVGLIDSDPKPRSVLGIPVVGDDSDIGQLRAMGVNKALVAVGDNLRRTDIARRIMALGFELINAISPAAVVSNSARVGRGVVMMAGAVIN